ncbi:MAG: hypothetical protein EXR71_13750 [Myxococcales bacterium]|nr:hypothetical protein [Myxococcales bacterium]
MIDPNVPRRVGVIDIGSGSTSLAVFDAGVGGFLDRLHQEGASLRLIETLDEAGSLPASAVRQLFSTLGGYVRRARALDVQDVHVVATSAMRDATNGAALVARMNEELGVSARLVSGVEEGQLAAHTVLCTLPMRDGIVLDLGGGSMQLVEVARRRVMRSVSLPLGALRLYDTFLRGADPPSGPALCSLRRHVVEALHTVPWLRRHRGNLVAVGGSARAYGKMSRRERPVRTGHGHGFLLDGEALLDGYEVLSRKPTALRAGTPGLASHRVDTIVAAGVVLSAVLRLGGFGGMHLSTYGIREGVAFRALFGDTPIADPGAAGIRGRLRAVPMVRPPAVSGLTPRERRLYAAALDHDAGRLLDKPIQGFWQEEVLRVARALAERGVAAGG